jgi:hypothetical protein
MATEDVDLDRKSPIIAHCSGSWLLEEKAMKFIQDNGQGILAEFKSDQALVVEEMEAQTKAKTKDSPLMTLRTAMQALEKRGQVTFELSGHTRERPQEVKLAQCEDQLLPWLMIFQLSVLTVRVSPNFLNSDHFRSERAKCALCEEKSFTVNSASRGLFRMVHSQLFNTTQGSL